MGSHSGQAHFLAAIDEAYNHKSWHGTNLRGSLRGLTTKEALWRPAPGRHCIYELALHCAYWKYVVWRRLSGARRGSFPVKGSNFFPVPPSAGDREWKAALSLLDAQHRQLRDFVAALPPARIEEPKVSFHLRGIAAHDLYHAGQIQLLKRLQSGPL